MKFPASVGQPSAARYAAAYKSTTNMAALTADTVFSAASNTLGAWLWRAAMISVLASANRSGIIAHTAAPGTLATGDVLSCGLSNGAGVPGLHVIDKPIFIPAGKGLYMLSEGLETLAYRQALYTLLT